MTINTIDPSTPDPDGVAGQGDDEIRAFKQVIADTFPQAPVSTPADPWDIVLAVGPRALNDVINKATNSDLAALDVRVGVNELAVVDHENRITSLEAQVAALDTKADILAAAWPVGSLYVAFDGQSPSSKGIPGTWTTMGNGRFLLNATSGFGNNVGTNALNLTAANIPAHKHTHTSFREASGQTGLIPSVYRTNPTATSSHLAGRDASSDEWAIYNTDSGIGTIGSTITLPTPFAINVRFYRRSA